MPQPPSIQLTGLSGDEYHRRFRDYLRARYDFLPSEFGCVEVTASDASEVRFANTTTLVILLSEHKGPYVGLDRVAAPAHTRFGAFSLFQLMKVRNSPHLNRIDGRIPEIDKFEIYADALRSCAADVLRGDFGVEPSVREHWDAERRRDAQWWARIQREGVERRASDAFRSRDFSTVVSLLTPDEVRLSPALRAKLDYVRRHH